MKKSKHRHEQNVSMERAPEHNPTVKGGTPSSTATVLKIQITEDGAGNISVEWLTQMKDTGVAVPMRPAHVIGTLEAAKHVLCKQYYDAPPKSIAPASA